ncbi:hypothetical protein P4K96_23380 [Bacillus cereus]|nr:hypothetical protein [Bacillus cereus]
MFQYEMKKLLINKSKLILLAVLFILYAVFAYASVMGEYELSGSEKKNAVSEYTRLVSENSGKLNPNQLAESQTIIDAVIAEHGSGEGFRYLLNRDPVLKFHYRYAAFGQNVNEYWNGPQEQDKGNIKGVYPLQEKLKELEADGQTGTYEYNIIPTV